MGLLLAPALARGCSPGDLQNCTVPHGSGIQHCDNGNWSSCVVAFCEFGYYIAGVAASCAPLFPENSRPAAPRTVTVTETVTSVATRPRTATTTAATSSSPIESPTSDGVQQRDAFCQGGTLNFMNAVIFSESGQADNAISSFAQGQELLRRALGLNGGCAANSLEEYLGTNGAAKTAATKLQAATGLKPQALASFTQEQAVLAGTAAEPSPAAGLQALLKRLPKSNAKAPLPPAHEQAAELRNGESAEASPPARSEEKTAALPLSPSGKALGAPAGAAKPNPTAPSKMAESSLLELKELQLMMTSGAAGEGGVVFDRKLRDYTIFTRVRLKYQKLTPQMRGP